MRTRPSLFSHIKYTNSYLIGAVLLIGGLPAFASSFNCGHAKTPVEVYVCLDYRVSDLDSSLATLYRDAQTFGGEAGALRSSQESWLNRRNQCRTPQCLIAAYRSRIGELRPEHALSREPEQEISWDYVAPPKQTISHLFVRKSSGRLAVTLAHRGKESMSADFAVSSNFRNLSLDEQRDLGFSEQLPPASNAIPLGRNVVKSVRAFTDYCGATPATRIGVFSSIPAAEADSPLRTLVAFLNKETSVGIQPCAEVELPVDQFALGLLHQFKESLFVTTLRDTAIIRFDRNLYSGSTILGRDLIVSWADDLKQMTKNYCSEDDVICIQQRISELIRFTKKQIT